MLPERASRTHVVPGNIMSVEFKLFDFMTLKQFLYLVVASFLGYLFIAFLPEGFIKYLLATIVIIFGIIVAFSRFNGEPFEVYTTNFILGIFQPTRRVWMKTPLPKKEANATTSSTTTPGVAQKTMQSLNDNYVMEEEVIPVDYNQSVTGMDLEEQKFLKTNQINDGSIKNSKSLAKADLSKLNFDLGILDNSNEEKNVEQKPLIQLTDVQNDTKSDNIFVDYSGSQKSQSHEEININSNNMNQDNIFGQSSISNTKPAFTINMDEEQNNEQQFVPLAQDKTQEEKAKEMPEIQLDFNSGLDQPVSEINYVDKPVNNFSQTAETNAFVPQSVPNTPQINPTVVNTIPEIGNINTIQSSPVQTPTIVEEKPQITFVEPSKVENKVVISSPEISAPEQITPKFVEPAVISETPITSTSVPPTQQDSKPSVLGKIHGKVISEDLSSKQNAVVTMYDETGKAIEAVITNEHGEFVFNSMPKSFELKIFPPAKYLFSPLDKVTKEIIIHEVPKDAKPGSFTTIFKDENSGSAKNITDLEDAIEMDTIDTKIPNTINGVVKDTKGHYLAGVLVSIKDASGSIIRALATNPLGQFFSLSPLQNGKYTVIFEKEGYNFDPYEFNIEGKVYPAKVFLTKNETVNS